MAWLLGLLGACSPGTVEEVVVDAGRQESGQGLSPVPPWDWPCPCPCPGGDSHPSLLHSLLPAGPSLPPRTPLTYPSMDVGVGGGGGSGTELWSRWTRARRARALGGPRDHGARGDSEQWGPASCLQEPFIELPWVFPKPPS